MQHALARVEQETELIVVDNRSSDGPVELVREDFSEAKCISLPRNRGFAFRTDMLEQVGGFDDTFLACFEDGGVA